MAAIDQASDDRIQLKRRFADFLEREFKHGDDAHWNYAKALGELYTTDDEKEARLISRRLLINEFDLREFDESLLQRILAQPSECLPAFNDAVKEWVRGGADPSLLKLLGENDDISVGLQGDFGKHEVSPRELTSAYLGKLVCLFGIVTKCSLVRPKVSWPLHFRHAWTAAWDAHAMRLHMCSPGMHVPSPIKLALSGSQPAHVSSEQLPQALSIGCDFDCDFDCGS